MVTVLAVMIDFVNGSQTVGSSDCVAAERRQNLSLVIFTQFFFRSIECKNLSQYRPGQSVWGTEG
jgi:hypothetical protein